MTMTEWHFDPDVEFPEHAHKHEQITKILEGTFRLTIEGKDYELNEGDALMIPPNARHSGRSLSSCHIVDVFYPVREDFR
jgi:quercetin dioxygenase-like cupin family protein